MIDESKIKLEVTSSKPIEKINVGGSRNELVMHGDLENYCIECGTEVQRYVELMGYRMVSYAFVPSYITEKKMRAAYKVSKHEAKKTIKYLRSLIPLIDASKVGDKLNISDMTSTYYELREDGWHDEEGDFANKESIMQSIELHMEFAREDLVPFEEKYKYNLAEIRGGYDIFDIVVVAVRTDLSNGDVVVGDYMTVIVNKHMAQLIEKAKDIFADSPYPISRFKGLPRTGTQIHFEKPI